MKLSIGIVGLPNVGKSTLFKILTKQEVNIANYPFATIDPNVGVVPVPDERLDKLADLSKSQKKIPAVVEFYDIAGLVKGANKGEGLGNQFLSHIRETQAIIHLVRCFKKEDVVHVTGDVNPLRDIEIVESELMLKDLETIERRLTKIESDVRAGKKEMIVLRDELLNLKKSLIAGEWLGRSTAIKELNLLTAKPQIFLLNGSTEDINADTLAKIKKKGDYLIADLAQNEDLSALIRKAYEILDLISFFTTGMNETRAWTIRKNTKAPEAAGVIHSDFETKFIRAEVIKWDKLLEAGTWLAAKQKGWLRIEGKDYTVQDGDVMEIRHG